MLDLTLKYVTLGSVMVGATAIYIALRNNSRQLGAQIFLAYTGRIHELRRSLSLEAYIRRLPANSEVDLTDEAKRAIFETLYLIFEFHALHCEGYVAKRIWKVWEPDIKRLLGTPTFRREWKLLQNEFAVHPDFVVWVTRMQQAV